MGYKGVVKNNAIVLEDDVELPEGAEVEVTTQGWWLSEGAKRNATDKVSFRRWLARCRKHREQMSKTTDSVQIIREIREARTDR
ncbi:hypothetical protein FJZ33_00260 [Candidatus Poribacteria bacterium]|nr:hypothetical protein [Candidatus Poribacteria bacterium]